MKKLQKLEPILWALIGFGLGLITYSIGSYFIVEMNVVDKTEAIQLFNEALNEKYPSELVVTEVILSTVSHCNPVVKNTIEKHCLQDIAVVFSNGSVLYGTCSTWSFKEFSCVVFQKRPPIINQDYGDRA